MTNLSNALFRTMKDLRENGFVFTDNSFSNLMCKSPRYISWVKASGHAPALEPMVCLFVQLDEMRNKYEASGDTSSAKEVDGITDNLWDAIRQAAIDTVPNRRRKLKVHGDGGELG